MPEGAAARLESCRKQKPDGVFRLVPEEDRLHDVTRYPEKVVTIPPPGPLGAKLRKCRGGFNGDGRGTGPLNGRPLTASAQGGTEPT